MASVTGSRATFKALPKHAAIIKNQGFTATKDNKVWEIEFIPYEKNIEIMLDHAYQKGKHYILIDSIVISKTKQLS